MKDLESTQSTISENVRTLVEQGSETIDAIRSRIDSVRTSMRDGGSVAFDRTVQFVDAHPFKAIAIAFGVGYAAMRVMTSPVLKLALLGAVGVAGKSVMSSSSVTR